ncbi:MAG: hypothetical protein U5N56_00010 [Candidatus Marinimicrobia bacterium]|nr:hypothetical protein [Candidatus Neomarinimicrobiota bacterium]
MYRGSGVPAIVYNKTVIELPRPIMDGRENPFTPITEAYENIDGELVMSDKRQWRYEPKFEFAKVGNDIINWLMEIYNRTAVVKFVPHIDVPQVAFMVLLEVVDPSDEVYKDGLILEMRSEKPLGKIPTIDNMLSCFQFNRVISHGG